MPLPGEEGPLRFRCHLLIRFDAFSVVHLRSSLYSTHDVIKPRLLTETFTTAAFDRSSSWLFEACSCKPASKSRPSSPAQHRVLSSAFLTQPLHGSGQAAFPHPALALGDDAHAPQRIGMTDRRQRQPARFTLRFREGSESVMNIRVALLALMAAIAMEGTGGAAARGKALSSGFSRGMPP